MTARQAPRCFAFSVLEFFNRAGKNTHVEHQAVQRHVFIGLMCQLLLAGEYTAKSHALLQHAGVGAAAGGHALARTVGSFMIGAT